MVGDKGDEKLVLLPKVTIGILSVSFCDCGRQESDAMRFFLLEDSG